MIPTCPRAEAVASKMLTEISTIIHAPPGSFRQAVRALSSLAHGPREVCADPGRASRPRIPGDRRHDVRNVAAASFGHR